MLPESFEFESTAKRLQRPLSSEVFPAPEEPRIAVTSPLLQMPSIFFRIYFSPYEVFTVYFNSLKVKSIGLYFIALVEVDG